MDPNHSDKSLVPCQEFEENQEPDLFERLYCYNDGHNDDEDYEYTPVIPEVPHSILLKSLGPFDDPIAHIQSQRQPKLTWKCLLLLLIITLLLITCIFD